MAGYSQTNTDIVLPQDGGYTFLVTYNAPNGTPINVTGYGAKLSIVEQFGDAPILTLTHSSGITVGGSNGIFTVSFTSAQTSAFTFTRALWDFFAIPPTGEPVRLVQNGTFTLSKSATVVP